MPGTGRERRWKPGRLMRHRQFQPAGSNTVADIDRALKRVVEPAQDALRAWAGDIDRRIGGENCIAELRGGGAGRVGKIALGGWKYRRVKSPAQLIRRASHPVVRQQGRRQQRVPQVDFPVLVDEQGPHHESRFVG